MADPPKKRRDIFRRAVWERNIPRRIFLTFSTLGAWDLFVAQFLPPKVAQSMPRVYDVAVMTGNLIPWWAWLLILMVVVTGSAVEYAHRQSRLMAAGLSTATPETNDDFWEIKAAVYWVARFSAWIRLQDAHGQAQGSEPLSEEQKIDSVGRYFLDLLEMGVLTSRGRLEGEIEFNDISPDFWKLVELKSKWDTSTIVISSPWKTSIFPRSELEPSAVAKLPTYKSVLVTPRDVDNLMPIKDKDMDEETKRLLEKAKQHGAR